MLLLLHPLFFCSISCTPLFLLLYIIAPSFITLHFTSLPPLLSLATILAKLAIMDSSKSSAILFICMLFISSAAPILGCGYCDQPKPTPKPAPKPAPKPTPKPAPGGAPGIVPKLPLPPVPKLPVPPVTVPKLPVPPVTVPKLPVPPVTVPKLPVPPVTVPKLPVPPVTVPKLPLPPVAVPKLPIPPVLPMPPAMSPPSAPGGKPCPPGGSPSGGKMPTCPIDALKLGACVDLLGGLVHIGLGDPKENKCCPILQGLAEAEAAVCLCTTLKLKVLNLNLYVPLALQLLLTCGKTPPPGFTCSL